MTRPTGNRGGRQQLLGELSAAGRDHSNAAVMFHTAVAERLGLNATDTKTLDFVERHGSLTPGRLVELTGLAPASVTGVLNRLEARGFVRRLRDPEDGRRQVIEIDRRNVPHVAKLFERLVTELDQLYDQYSVAELRLVLDWMTSVTEIQREAAAELTAAGSDGVMRSHHRRAARG